MFLGLLPPFSQEQVLSEDVTEDVEDEELSEEKAPAEVEDDGKNLSSSLLHLVLLQVSFSAFSQERKR